jgi:predicted PurR-regulated permease PerM
MQLQSFGDDLPELKSKISEKADALLHYIRDSFEVGENDQTSWVDKKISQTLDSGDRYLIPVFTVTGILITNIILIPLYIYFLILYRNKVKIFITLLSHNGTHEQTFFILSKIVRLTQRYLKGILLDALIDSILLSIGLFLLGIKHAMLFGALVAITNIVIPYMGITLGGLLPFAMAIVTKDQFGYALGVMAICVTLQFIDNHFINPYVVGSSVSINSLTALLGLVAAALIWGVYGMLLCIPVLGMLKVVCDNVEPLKPFGFIIGQETEFGKKSSGKKLLHKIAPKTQDR